MIFFGYNSWDPKTEPWTQVVSRCVLSEVLAAIERERPKHPLVAVFKPLLAESDELLRRKAVEYYRSIKYSELTETRKSALEAVFISWLEQRLKQSKKEIEAMLLGELPDLEETPLGKELIQIGEQRGEQIGEQIGEQRGKEQGLKQGLQEAILLVLNGRYGAVTPSLEAKIRCLSAEDAKRLLQCLSSSECSALDDVDQWLDARGGKS